MADESVARRTKLWTGRGAPIRYRWHERWSDWWCASRDARSGTPAVPTPPTAGPAGPPPISMGKQTDPEEPATRWGTPRTVALGQLGRLRAEREWVLFHADTAHLQIDRAEAAARERTAASLVAATTADLEARVALPAAEAEKPAPGEEDASPELVRNRRLAEHEARLQELRSRVRAAQSAIDDAAEATARLDEQIRIRREVAEVRVAMIEAHVRRRCSAYLGRLVRIHPDGERVGTLIRTDWDQRPSWLQDRWAHPVGGA